MHVQLLELPPVRAFVQLIMHLLRIQLLPFIQPFCYLFSVADELQQLLMHLQVYVWLNVLATRSSQRLARATGQNLPTLTFITPPILKIFS